MLDSVGDRLAEILKLAACPQCDGSLTPHTKEWRCMACDVRFPIHGDIVDLRPRPLDARTEDAWSEHWSEEHQRSLPQRVFSMSRKAIFARVVGRYVNRYFPKQGVFLEAGSGTSETSVRVEKCNGSRLLVAVDVVLGVLEKCHPVMDVRLAGDIFRLPFRAGVIDGIWNVGVMEHFEHAQIDRIMREFHRVLRRGAPVILLWPGADALPQRVLGGIERIVNASGIGQGFKFNRFPDEISRLKSRKEGHDVLKRNSFRVIEVDSGVRSLMAFKTLVGVME